MRSLKTALLASFALLVAAVATAADADKPKEKGRGQRLNPIAESMLRVDRLKTVVGGLELNDDQKEKLGKIRDEFDAKQQAVIQKLAEILTEEQKQAAQQILQEAEQSGKKGRETYVAIETALKLTDEQKQKLEPIGKELRTAVQDATKQVMETLNDDQRQKVEQQLGMGKKGKRPERKTDQK